MRPFLRAVKISKRYGAVEALRSIDLDIFPGEVIGLVGDISSGKSTLVRLMAGEIQPDGGQFYVQDRPVRLSPPHRAARYSIKTVHQDIHVAAHMSAIGYIFAGQPFVRPTRLRALGWWDHKRMLVSAREEFERLGFETPPLDRPLHDLTNAQRKMVSFVQATIGSPRLLLLDEPMKSLEVYKPQILRLILNMRQRGGSVLLVTQNVEDIFSVSDWIVVLNEGRKIAARRAVETTEEEIVRLIVGSAEQPLTPAVWALSNYSEVRRQAEELNRLNQALEQRALQLQAHADVARITTSILDRDRLLVQIVQTIQQRFNYYHVAIFLLDEAGEYAVLRSSASQGKIDPEWGDIRLGLGDGMIGGCAAHGELRLANDISQSRALGVLPGTRSELALPLRVGSRVLGVLDLQCDRTNAFSNEDVLVLHSLADQLAIAIRNADLFETARIARQQADEANRFKSIFLSNMSHELRTPLSAIIGHTQAILSPTTEFYHDPIPDEYRHDLETIRKSGEHLLALINDLLDLSRIEAGEFKLNCTVLNLVDILDEALQTASGLIYGRPIDLRRDYPSDLPFVWGDNIRTRQIVLNLIANAAKFTEQGSITLEAKTSENQVIVSITDTGIGVPAHLQGSIFERFHRGDVATAKKYGGTGLGLNISKQLVELQGGRIWLTSEVGVGSVFSFTIILATPDQLAVGQPSQSAAWDTRRSMVFEDVQKVNAPLFLLAQNEPFAPPGLREALEGFGCVVEVSAVEDQVIEIADVMQPDLIILDATNTKGAALLKTLRDLPIPLLVFGDGEFDKNTVAVKTILQDLRANGHLDPAIPVDRDASPES